VVADPASEERTLSLDVNPARSGARRADATAGSAARLTPSAPVVSRGYDPARDRENMRGRIAVRLLGLLVVTILAPYALMLVRAACLLGGPAAVCAGFPALAGNEVLTATITPVVALVGAATGFYFGEKRD
jgi:hypothetical protein